FNKRLRGEQMNRPLEEQVAYLEEKVIQLEKQLQDKTKPKTLQSEQLQSKELHPSEQKKPRKKWDDAATTEVVLKENYEAHDTATSPHQKIRPEKQSQQVSEQIQWDVFIFQKLLPRVFIFILILGVVWGLKASYDYG